MRRLIGVAAAFGVYLASLAPGWAQDDAQAKVSRPFEYRGYGEPAYASQRREAVYVPMRDGVKLAVTLFFPEGGPAGRRPTILWYLPGHRESIDPQTGALTPYGSPEQIRFFNSHGYVWAIAEMRGSGASFGARHDRSPQIGRDGKDLVEWLARQRWSNGAVGMVGLSYQGFSQYATAAERPAGLKAIFPEIAGFDEYSVMFYPGGVLNVAMSSFASASIARDDQNFYLPATAPSGQGADMGPRRALLPAAPVIDEDGDGELADEIPIDKNGNGTFLDDGPPTYHDGVAREDVYYEATRQHLDNVNLTAERIGEARYRDSKPAGVPWTYAELGPADRPASIASSGIAVYNRAGWFDYHARCAAQWFASLSGKTPSKLLIAPTAHSGFPGGRSNGGPYWPLFHLQLTEADLNTEKLRFFDRWLKGVDNGVDREPPVYIYVMGKGWRAEQEWPVARAVATRYHLAEGGRLQRATPRSGQDEHVLRLDAKSRTASINRWNYRLASAPAPMRPVADPAHVVYESAPLPADVEVIGHPLVQLSASARAPDADFFIYLEDVAADGAALTVSDGMLRASFAGARSEDDIVAGAAAFDVRPSLPWQGFGKADHNPRVFADGRAATLRFDLMPTAWVFKKGHRIRIAITGADWPTFELNPLLSPKNDPADEDNLQPAVTLHRGGQAPSYLELPIVCDSGPC